MPKPTAQGSPPLAAAPHNKGGVNWWWGCLVCVALAGVVSLVLGVLVDVMLVSGLVAVALESRLMLCWRGVDCRVWCGAGTRGRGGVSFKWLGGSGGFGGGLSVKWEWVGEGWR